MIALLLFVIGVCVGSFLNVAVFRTHEDDSLIKGRSKCQKCEIPLGACDLVPVLSFFLLKGRCRSCKSVLDWQYPLVELATGLFFVLVYLVHLHSDVLYPLALWQGELLLYRDLVLVGFLVVLFVYDLRYYLILDRFTIPAMIFVLIANLFIGVLSPLSMLIGAVVLGGFFLVQFVLSKGTWIGGGDIRMGVLMGLILGWELGLVGLFIAYLLGAVIALLLLATKRVDRKTQLPFGVFLTLATFVTMLFGEQLLSMYLGFLQ